MSDPYIEAQKRLDSGKTTSVIVTEMSGELRRQCQEAISLPSITEIKHQIQQLKRLKFLEAELESLRAQIHKMKG